MTRRPYACIHSFHRTSCESNSIDAGARSRTTCTAGQQIGIEDRATERGAAVLLQASSLDGAFPAPNIPQLNRDLSVPILHRPQRLIPGGAASKSGQNTASVTPPPASRPIWL